MQSARPVARSVMGTMARKAPSLSSAVSEPSDEM